MPTRVITGGLGPVPGATMQERRLYFEEHLDHLRLLLMREPRGHSAMSGAFLQPPTRPDADWGVLFVEVSGLLPMCGHGTIGVATVLVETGMVEVTEPQTRIRLDTPAGLVEATVSVCDGRAERVTLRNVPAFTVELDGHVRVGSLGEVEVRHGLRRQLLCAGSCRFGWPRAGSGQRRGTDRARPGDRRRDQRERGAGASGRCGDPRLQARCVPCSGTNGADARNATAIHPGWLDRSPCGTGTSARMAALHARGELALGQEFVNESIIGSRFTGRLVEEVDRRRHTRGGARGQWPRLDHRDGPVPARSDRPLPDWVRPVARRRSCAWS